MVRRYMISSAALTAMLLASAWCHAASVAPYDCSDSGCPIQTTLSLLTKETVTTSTSQIELNLSGRSGYAEETLSVWRPNLIFFIAPMDHDPWDYVSFPKYRELTVIPSKPDLPIEVKNLSGTQLNRAGEASTFDILFQGSGVPAEFELLIIDPVRGDTLASIPVTVNVPEPASAGLSALGVAMAAFGTWRRRTTM